MARRAASGPLVIVGDALLDRDVEGQAERLCPDAPALVVEETEARLRPGGAALAALLAATIHDAEVVLIAPLGDDEASATVKDLLGVVTVIPVPLAGPLQEKTRIRAAGQTLLRVDKPAGIPGPAGSAAVEAISAAGALLVSDYGRGTTADPRLREALSRRAARVPLVWDPHLKGTEPVPGTHLATPNGTEAAQSAGVPAGGVLDAAAAADCLLSRWPIRAVAVTLGRRGALLARPGQAPLAVPAAELRVTDPCGAGDQFAVAVASSLRNGATMSEATTWAVAAATRFLAAGGVSGLASEARWAKGIGGDGQSRQEQGGPGRGRPPWAAPFPRGHTALDVAETVRGAGGVVVAAGGCFDVLHAGHVSMLKAARSLGDCLIVCMNSDDSVRRLKGPGRPLNPAADRAAVLTALDGVDEVAIFDEDTPERLLEQLKPAIWVKGGDYDGRELPEAAALRRWGGRAVTVPYLTGRSTSRIASAAGRAPQGA